VHRPSPQNAQASLPPGMQPRLSALETASRRGIGPLSGLGQQVWHGHARPCVSCGELAPRDAACCPHCGQDLSVEMIDRMRQHAGPWYVHEHVRPFPGVTLERLIRQARRGVLNATTIVRGPTTDHQWRFAGETPGLCKHVGMCWYCQGPVSAQVSRCDSCGVDLDRAPDAAERERMSAHVSSNARARAQTELDQLSAVLQSQSDVAPMPRRSRPAGKPRPMPAWLFGVAVIIVFVIALVAVVQLRKSSDTLSDDGKTMPDAVKAQPESGTEADPPVDDEIGPLPNAASTPAESGIDSTPSGAGD